MTQRLLLAMSLATLFASTSGCSPTNASCRNECLSAGTRQCSGTGAIVTCEVDASGCLAWSSPSSCGGGQFCDAQQNACVQCDSDCTMEGATKCSGPQVQVCLKDSNGCLNWAAATSCPNEQHCDAVEQRCTSCADTCPGSGITRCAGEQVETCATNNQGCLAWTAPANCAGGEVCNASTNSCGSACSTSAVQSACTTAANDLNQCCGGTLASFSSNDLCSQALSSGGTPQVTCSDWGSRSCATWHSTFLQDNVCCCPDGQTCDPRNGYACVQTCDTDADCTGGKWCAAVSVNDVIIDKKHVCRPKDGQPWDGCSSGIGAACPGQYHCMREAGTLNQYCTLACSTDSQCGNPGVACCRAMTCDDSLSSSCPTNGKACAPCP